jgi:hypothetical protein
VFTSDKVTQEWHLQYQGIKITGVPSCGHAALVADKNLLRVVLARETFGKLLSRIDLSEKLCEFFSIHDSRRSCLSDILSEDDHDMLGGLMERHGIPRLDVDHRTTDLEGHHVRFLTFLNSKSY